MVSLEQQQQGIVPVPTAAVLTVALIQTCRTLNNFQVFLRHRSRMMPRKMFVSMRQKLTCQFIIKQNLLNLFCECVGIAIWKSNAAGTDCFRQPAATRSDRNAPAGDAFESDHAKRFVPQ